MIITEGVFSFYSLYHVRMQKLLSALHTKMRFPIEKNNEKQNNDFGKNQNVHFKSLIKMIKQKTRFVNVIMVFAKILSDVWSKFCFSVFVRYNQNCKVWRS